MEDMKQVKTPDLIDTTDCLEAIGVMRSMKNFMVVLIFSSMLILAVIPGLELGGRINQDNCTNCPDCSALPTTSKADSGLAPVREQSPKKTGTDTVVPFAAATEKKVDVLSDAPKTNEPNEKAVNTPASSQLQTDQKQNHESAVEPLEDKTIPAIFRIKLECRYVVVTIKACNFILVFASLLYCLILLFSLKISLTGRLGGINHIARAFFLSLFALVILLPWQVLLPGVVTGMLYLPMELLSRWSARASQSAFWMTVFCLRFFGLWLVVFLLYVMAQVRSGKWNRATLRRLGLVR